MLIESLNNLLNSPTICVGSLNCFQYQRLVTRQRACCPTGAPLRRCGATPTESALQELGQN
jgi:hypothetical protein